MNVVVETHKRRRPRFFFRRAKRNNVMRSSSITLVRSEDGSDSESSEGSCIPVEPTSCILKSSLRKSHNMDKPRKSVHWNNNDNNNNNNSNTTVLFYCYLDIPTEEDIRNAWYSPIEMAEIRQHDHILFRSELASPHYSHITPTVKVYLQECRSAFEAVQRRLLETNESSIANGCNTPWDNGNSILRKGSCYFRGMESGRMAWRKNRTKRILRTVVRAQPNTHTLAQVAADLTRADQHWAYLLAQRDVEELASPEFDAMDEAYETFFEETAMGDTVAVDNVLSSSSSSSGAAKYFSLKWIKVLSS